MIDVCLNYSNKDVWTPIYHLSSIFYHYKYPCQNPIIPVKLSYNSRNCKNGYVRLGKNQRGNSYQY